MGANIEVPESMLDYVESILDDELRLYIYTKFSLEVDMPHTREFGKAQVPFDNTYWKNQLEQYLHRSYILGLDNPNGRQALMKFVATGISMLATTAEMYGELPEPGVPSGENLDNLRPFGEH